MSAAVGRGARGAGTLAGVVRGPAPDLAAALQWPTRMLADAVLEIANAAARIQSRLTPDHVRSRSW